MVDALTKGWELLSGISQNGMALRSVSMAVGHLCFLLLTVCTASGLLAHTRWFGRQAQWWLDETHAWAGAWTVHTALVHTLLLHYGGRPMSWASLLLPNFQGAHGLELALGIYGLYAFLAVTVTGYLVGAIKGYLWRWIHWLSFPAWLLALLHSVLLMHGFRPWQIALYGGSALLILLLASARFTSLGKKAAPQT